jgi:hypothetical protein
MRRWMIVLAILAVAVTFGSINANAQSEIVIGEITNTPNTITFNGSVGGPATMTFDACTGPCILTTQQELVLGSAGSSTFTLSASSYALVSETTAGGNWSIAGLTAGYSFTGGAGTLGGTVTFDQLVTNGAADLVGTLTVTSGTGAVHSTFGDGNYKITFSAAFTGGNSLECIFNPATTLSTCPGTYSATATAGLPESGAISATPEPTAMLLYGTGIFLIGGILRRRLV